MGSRKVKELEKIIDILLAYDGYNPLLQRLRNNFKKNRGYIITDTQKKYIKNFHDFQPLELNKIVNFTTYFGEQLKENEGLEFVPEKIFIYYYLGSTDNSHHVLGKLTKSQQPKEYWIPKKQILGDILYEIKKIDVDYSRYNELLSKVGRKVLPHQPEAVEFLLSRQKLILADGMGMCKTASTIIASIEGNFNKVLIISPASAKINWSRELGYLSIPENDIAIIRGNKWISGKKYTIINYDILDNFYQYIDGRKKKEILEMCENSELFKENFDLVIIDEAHFLSNAKSERSKTVDDFVFRCNITYRWLLTGTPMRNKPINYYNLLKIIDCPVADDWRFFVTRYCAAKQITNRHTQKKVWLTDGASNLDELYEKTKHLILKRDLVDYIDMPEKISIPQFFELSSSQRSKYIQLYDEYIDYKLEHDLDKYIIKGKIEKRHLEKELDKARSQTEIDKLQEQIDFLAQLDDPVLARGIFINDLENMKDLVETMVLRKYMAMEMLPNTFEQIDIALEEGSNVIVFTTFTEELMEIHEKYKSCSVIHYGEMSDVKKQASVDKFQNDDKCKVFVGNLTSAGVAITLTKGDIVIFNTMSWVPSDNDQAFSRTYRNGRKEPVTIYYNMFSDTITEKIYMDNLTKKSIIDQVIR